MVRVRIEDSGNCGVLGCDSIGLQVASSLKLFGLQVVTVFDSVSGPLAVDCIGAFIGEERRYLGMHHRVVNLSHP